MKSQTLLIATSNPGKLQEMQSFLSHIPHLHIVSLADLKEKYTEPEENGSSFAENALIKASYYFEKTGLPTLAEDSGIEIEALQNELGIKTRRWGAGEKASDEEWISFFLKRMKNEHNKKARFFCSACLIMPQQSPLFFEGSADGEIVMHSDVPLQKGIPLSSYFIANGASKVFAAMNHEEKNRISHRGKAMKALSEYLLYAK